MSFLNHSGYAERLERGDFKSPRGIGAMLKAWILVDFWSALLRGFVFLSILVLMGGAIIPNFYQGICQLILATAIGISLFGHYIKLLQMDYREWKITREMEEDKLKWADKDSDRLFLSKEEEEFNVLLEKAKNSTNPIDHLFQEVGSLEKKTGWSLSTFIIWMAFVKEAPQNMDNLTFLQYLGVVNRVIALFEQSAENPIEKILPLSEDTAVQNPPESSGPAL